MKQWDEILAAYMIARQKGERCLLATLVKAEGSSYRQVGARMLMTSGGGHTGTISGGCLEAEIQKKAWWLTELGATIQQYRTSSEDLMELSGLETSAREMPYGLGCSGTLHILLKRVDEHDAAWLERLGRLREERVHAALATVLSGPNLGKQWLFPAENRQPQAVAWGKSVWNALGRVAAQATSEYLRADGTDYFLEALPPRQRLVIFGAGDDAKPLVQFARLLGWDITVADGRAHLATPARFPEATRVIAAPATELPLRCALSAEDAVVIMTHSFEQDQAFLRTLLRQPLRYLGQLGPRKRTKELLASVVQGCTDHEPKSVVENHLHAPIGLDIGAHTPETIALAIIAEVQSEVSKLQRASLAKMDETAVGVPA